MTYSQKGATVVKGLNLTRGTRVRLKTHDQPPWTYEPDWLRILKSALYSSGRSTLNSSSVALRRPSMAAAFWCRSNHVAILFTWLFTLRIPDVWNSKCGNGQCPVCTVHGRIVSFLGRWTKICVHQIFLKFFLIIFVVKTSWNFPRLNFHRAK